MCTFEQFEEGSVRNDVAIAMMVSRLKREVFQVCRV